jgi:hypothetical protein
VRRGYGFACQCWYQRILKPALIPSWRYSFRKDASLFEKLIRHPSPRDVQELEEGLPYPRCTVWNRKAGSPSKRD